MKIWLCDYCRSHFDSHDSFELHVWGHFHHQGPDPEWVIRARRRAGERMPQVRGVVDSRTT